MSHLLSSSLPSSASGPLRGVRVVEFAGLGPAPFACMLLSDMGAEVVRIDRPGTLPTDPHDITGRGRRTVLLDLKDPASIDQVLDLLAHADVLVEGFRPGVMERLGLGPEAVARRNPRLVYGRMTGWGQHGPLAQAAGHDINYIAITGALAAIGAPGGAPVPPLNLVGDYGGGSLYLVAGLLAALLEARASGQGQVVDAAICDGALSLMSNNQSHRLRGLYREQRGSNMLDGGAPYYTTYETADAQYVSIGPIEPKFFALLCQMIGLPETLWDAQHDRARWHALRDAMAAVFRTRSRAQWCELLEGTDVCFAPVLTLAEAAAHPHLRARQAIVEVAGVPQPAPAPRFSRTPSAIQSRPDSALQLNSAQLLADWAR
ncbi:CaiB/BaiF CoA-transferase family protein [Acidovorax sp.]|uniref:CaiB/BaiF CoA transferase family protein n=1 Tax=Acidovorax sp. TaxID=1872122 RepID=UPI002ACDC136|nr:CaiB/BaiF CoA-transferase family protein [Acidovorax sp.]MDZ7864250.1 CaiB/BaiF CoA-transferase family protein [Acidovorax sp.]